VDFDFEILHKRLLLLDSQVLREVALFLGLSLLTPLLRHWLDAEAQRYLRSEIGEGAYTFFCQQVLPLPAVARVRMSTERAQQIRKSPHLLRTASCYGASLLFASCGGLSVPAVKRARLKFPRAIADLRGCPSLSEESVQRVSELAIGCVVRERHVAWHWLF
jgi:hypothetical protein